MARPAKLSKTTGEESEALYKTIGQLKVEVDWLKKIAVIKNYVQNDAPWLRR